MVDGTPRGTYEFGNYDVVNIDYIRCDGYSINLNYGDVLAATE